MRRIYVSGPMTGFKDHNYPAFKTETARLRALGYEVVCPTEINPSETASERTWAECLRRDLKEMLACDTIALLPGWRHSRGVSVELRVAQDLGFTVCLAEEITKPLAALEEA